ncbi:MAG: hypothetical protein ACX98W_01850 [bacterium]
MIRRLRGQARDWKRRSLRFRPGTRPNLAIFGIRRGGSTLLADMVAAERGVFFVDEPFAVFAPQRPFHHEIRAALPERMHGQLFDMTPEECQAVEAFVSRILSLDLRIGAARRTRGLGIADRVAMKILNAPLLIDWLVGRFDLRSLIRTRHPAAQARSVLRLGWGFSAEAYFASDPFVERHFDAEQIRVGREILAGEDLWSKAVLNWIIESWIPLREASPALPRLSYEELVVDGERILPDVFRHLELDAIDRALALLARPSGSSRMSTASTQQAIAAGDTQALVGRWMDQTDEDERRRGQEILDLFGADLYVMDDPMPKRRLHSSAVGEEGS